METAFIVLSSPPWDCEFHYTPIEVFVGADAEERAEERRGTLQSLANTPNSEIPEIRRINGYSYSVLEAPLNRE